LPGEVVEVAVLLLIGVMNADQQGVSISVLSKPD